MEVVQLLSNPTHPAQRFISSAELSSTLLGMADDRIWSAAELERLSLAERQQLLNDRVVTDLSTVPQEFLDRVRAEALVLIEQRGLITHPGDGG